MGVWGQTGRCRRHRQGSFGGYFPEEESKLSHAGWRSESRGLKMELVKPRVSEATVKTRLFLSEG